MLHSLFELADVCCIPGGNGVCRMGQVHLNQGCAMALHAAPSKNLQRKMKRQDLYKLWAWPKVRSTW